MGIEEITVHLVLLKRSPGSLGLNSTCFRLKYDGIDNMSKQVIMKTHTQDI